MRGIVIAALFAAALGSENPTRLPDMMVAAPATTYTAIRVLTPQGWVLVQPDATIVLDLKATPPAIRAVLPALAAVRVCWDVTSASQEFTLAVNPADVLVFRNGLLMRPVADYVWTGQTVKFTVAQGLAVGDVVQIIYGGKT